MSVTDSITTLVVTADRWDGDGPPAFWPIFPILWFLVIAGIIAAVVVLRRRSCEGMPRRAGEARLAEMYAAGEISEEDYRARRTVLREK
ncbi:SHOCT domain-containing protein [Nocardioides immobilis]|uniref:SHOCT domain-containing protein n=1 Tax=Nocardioides immobilis TaxID=2049295 RepID=A0A417Y1D9_9ACTN|nr:SHOCT domain-containing protein [Nocardioides immobilis]RHW26478.1 SHOCT domain-containing protein [Nocardioides immobilis]